MIGVLPFVWMYTTRQWRVCGTHLMHTRRSSPWGTRTERTKKPLRNSSRSWKTSTRNREQWRRREQDCREGSAKLQTFSTFPVTTLITLYGSQLFCLFSIDRSRWMVQGSCCCYYYYTCCTARTALVFVTWELNSTVVTRIWYMM